MRQHSQKLSRTTHHLEEQIMNLQFSFSSKLMIIPIIMSSVIRGNHNLGTKSLHMKNQKALPQRKINILLLGFSFYCLRVIIIQFSYAHCILIFNRLPQHLVALHSTGGRIFASTFWNQFVGCHLICVKIISSVKNKYLMYLNIIISY